MDLVFWKELNKCFSYFLLGGIFFPMLGNLSIRLLGGRKELPHAHFQKIVHSWQQFCHRICTLNVYTDIQTVQVLVVETECIQFFVATF